MGEGQETRWRDSERQSGGGRVRTVEVSVPRSSPYRRHSTPGRRYSLSGCGEHDGMVRGDRDPHGEALRTHWKPGAPRCRRRIGRSENWAGLPQKVPKVPGGAKCRGAVSVRKEMAPQVGLEPTTLRLTAGCSAIELLRSVCALRQRIKF